MKQTPKMKVLAKWVVLTAVAGTFAPVGSASAQVEQRGVRDNRLRSEVAPPDAVASSEDLTGCVCDCVYVKREKIRNHSYFASAGGSCGAIEGQACLGTLRGDTFRGTITQCLVAPRQLGTPANPWGPTSWITVKAIGNRQK